jgi:integrase
MKRADKTGTITPLPDGRLWVRAAREADGKRPTLGYCATQEEAEALLAADRANAAAEPLVFVGGARSFLKHMDRVLDAREKNGIRSIEQERHLCDAHLRTAFFATWDIDKIRPKHIARWLQDMSQKKALIGRRGQKSVESNRPLAKSSITRVFTILTTIMQEACPQGADLIETNPCVGMKVKRRAGKEATKEKEVFLTLDEQRDVDACERIPREDRRFILFAFGCGVRRGEQFNIDLADVHVFDASGQLLPDPHVIVRFGSDGKPRKNDKILRVELFGYALQATIEQLRALDRGDIPNPLGLLWPTATGARRKGKPLGNGHFREVEPGKGTHVYKGNAKNPTRAPKGKGTHVYVDRFKEYLSFAGITRRVRWHDLRHTCASALLQGQWGDAWKLAAVSAQLGHSSLAVTERYAHLGTTLTKEAAKTIRVGGALVRGPDEQDPRNAAIRNDINFVEPRGIEPLTSSMPSKSMLELLRALADEKGPSNPLITNLANTLAALLEN